MESCLAQVLQKDVGKRLQVGQELIDYFSDKQKSADLEHDQTMLDKLVDGLATSWVNSSNYKVSRAPGGTCIGGRAALVGPNWSLGERIPLGEMSKILWPPVGHSGCGFWTFHSEASRVYSDSCWRLKKSLCFSSSREGQVNT